MGVIYDPLLGKVRKQDGGDGIAKQDTLLEVQAAVDSLVSGCEFDPNDDGEDTVTMVIDDTISIEGETLIS